MPASLPVRLTALAAVALTPLVALAPASAQQPAGTTSAPSRGWELTGLPALNYDADEGVGYGALVEAYDYGPGIRPYRLTIQPTLFLTTEGRRDLTWFVDAPVLGNGRWRITSSGGFEHQLAMPWYGVGNATSYDAANESKPNEHYYRYGRDRRRLTVDLQRTVGRTPLRVLVGAGLSSTRVDLTPFDEGTTLLAQQLGGVTPERTRENYARAGVVWDTRDREIGTRRGAWGELLVQRTSRGLAATSDWTRVTGTWRGYVPLGEKVVFAQRWVGQAATGDLPFTELPVIASSFKEQEGLGGAKTLRGIPRDRYVGPALALVNTELRWRAREGRILGKPSHVVLTGFLDGGRVWSDVPNLADATSDIVRDWHFGYGGGVRVVRGESFVVAVDVGHSRESTAPFYIGLGYLF